MNRKLKWLEGLDLSHLEPRSPEEAEYFAAINKEAEEEDAKDRSIAAKERRISRLLMSITIPPGVPIVPAHLLRPLNDD